MRESKEKNIKEEKKELKTERTQKTENKVENKDFRHIVRIMNTDLPGEKAAIIALQNIKGVGFSMANAVCRAANIDPTVKIGTLNESQTDLLQQVLANPQNFGIPSWLYNRRRDPYTGKDFHVLGLNVELTRKEDIDKLKIIKCYKGIRHIYGLPVRGQRTRSNFRKNKGKVVGVLKRAAKAAKSAKEQEKK
ncbi:MAG: 30S ribosomal protein S13 [Candidatus Woesearchaeota archaeon]